MFWLIKNAICKLHAVVRLCVSENAWPQRWRSHKFISIVMALSMSAQSSFPTTIFGASSYRSHSVFFDSSALNHFSDSIKIKLKSIVNFTGQSTILILNIGVPFPFLARRSMISSCICFCIYASVVSTLLQFFCNELKLSLLESKIHFFSSAGSFNFGQVALLGSLKWFVSPLWHFIWHFGKS